MRGAGDVRAKSAVSPAPASTPTPTSTPVKSLDLKALAEILVNEAEMADGPNLTYFDFITKSDGLPAEDQERLLNELVTAGQNSKSDSGLNAGLGVVLQRLVVAKPSMAGKWLLAHLEIIEDELQDRIWKAIQVREPQALTQLQTEAKDPAAKEFLTKLVLSQLAKSKPAEAATAAMEQADPAPLSEAMRQWKQQDAAASFQWAISRPPAQLGRAILARCGQDLTEAESKKLVELFPTISSEAGANLNWQPVADQVMGYQMKSTGIDEVRKWLEQLPLTDLKLAIHKSFAAVWLKSDAAAASQWIAALPGSPEREISIVALVESILPSDPERAYGWAKQLQSQTAKFPAMKSAMQQWLKQNPVNAAKALELAEPEFREALKE